MAVDSTGGVMASGAQDCALVQQTVKITRLAQWESANLIKTYVSAQSCPAFNVSQWKWVKLTPRYIDELKFADYGMSV